MRKKLNFTAPVLLGLTSLGLTLASPSLAQEHAAPAVDPTLAEALANDRRAEDMPRDIYRHPAETLTFFGVKPGMSVVDFMPSSGWYSRILIPYLGEDGTYIGLNPKIAPDAGGFMAGMRNTAEELPGQATGWVGDTGASVVGANVGAVPEELEGTVDRVLIFREIHNMRRFNWFYDSLQAMRSLLKDDGLLGVVQHRARSNAPASYTNGSKGYQREKDVIALFAAHGFDLVATSEINANPKDPADHPNGVWTLPPVFAGANEDTRPALEAIGESDRMTLLFRKRP